jgi:hypothetical protein
MSLLISLLLGIVTYDAHAQAIGPLPAIDNKNVQIWWGPMILGLDASGAVDFSVHDFPQLLTEPAEWPATRAALTTLELPGGIFPGYALTLNVAHWLNNHPFIKVNMTGEYVSTGGTCGSGEGFDSGSEYSIGVAASAQAWQQAGGRLNYSVMDAPLFYARVPASQGGCGWNIQQIAENVSKTMKVLNQYFPGVKIIDSEGPASESTSDWLADMEQFHSALAALGTPIYGTEIDESWHNVLNGETYAEVIAKSVPFFHFHGERVGLILDLDGSAADEADDATYLAQYRINAQTIANGRFGEDWVAVESWNFNMPKCNLPETKGTAFSSIVPLLQELLGQ